MSFSQWLPQFPDNAFTSDVIVLGYMMSLVINFIVNLVLLMLFFVGRLRKTGVPVWLLVVNFLFFAVQIVFLVLNRNLR